MSQELTKISLRNNITMGTSMKNFLVSIMLLFAVTQLVNSPVKYWKCKNCHEIHKGDTLPKPMKCIGTRFDRFHEWVPLELC